MIIKSIRKETHMNSHMFFSIFMALCQDKASLQFTKIRMHHKSINFITNMKQLNKICQIFQPSKIQIKSKLKILS